MRLVDSSCWIEWLSGSFLGAEIERLLPPKDEWVVPTMVQFELVNWARRVEPETQRFEDLVAFTKTCVIVPLSTEIAVDAAGLSLDHGLAAADAIIYATATSLDADLLTCDAHFERLPRVVYIPKQAN